MMDQDLYDLLVVDPDETSANLLGEVASGERLRFCVAKNGAQAFEYLDDATFRVVVLETELVDFSGFQILEWLKTQAFCPEIIMMSQTHSLEPAIKALKLGAMDYWPKPLSDREALKKSIVEALSKHKLNEALKSSGLKKNEDLDFENMVGRSAPMQEIYGIIRSVAATSSNILIQGESGTGKEMAARAIHRLSLRRDKPFVVINCAALPETLLESELFGFVKGAFTGAEIDKIGLFETAHSGTVFLDEIGEIPSPIQVKLLRVLQGGEITRLGSTQNRKIDVRIIAATNRDLQSMTDSGRFREDLFYRINVISLHLPPLRKRPEDLPLLASFFADKICSRIGKKIEKISIDFLQAIQAYSWPGNVRELENIMERAIVLNTGTNLSARSLPPKILSASFYTPPREEDDLSELSYQEAKKRTLNIFNRSYIIHLLKKTDGNITVAAERAGLDRSNFKKIMKKNHITGPFKF